MPRKKKELVVLPRQMKRQPGYFILYFGGKCVGSRLTLEDLLPKYFINLEKNLDSSTDLEQLLKKYEITWKTKGKIEYIDSWGHRWEQGPSKSKLLDYLVKAQTTYANSKEV